MITKIDYVASWADRLYALFYEQYKASPNLIKFKDLLAQQFQDLEDAFQSLLSIPSIDDGEGVHLDVIGRIIGQLRLGIDDPTYRHYLRAKNKANHSTITPEDLYAVLRAMLGVTTSMVYTPGDVASFELRVRDVLTSMVAAIAAGFIGIAGGAGIRGIFEWQEDVDANLFYTGLIACNLGSAGSGSTSLTVDSTAGFPATGSLLLDYGSGSQETVTYSVTDGSTFAVSALVFPHSIGISLEYVGDPGLGFGDATNPATGGEFIGAVDAA